MVSAIVSLLSTVGSALPVYVRHGLVRVINGQPCADVGGGDYRPVVIDVEGGVLYWRQTGKMRVDAADIMSPCAGVRVRVPLRLVAVVEVGVCDDPTSRAMATVVEMRNAEPVVRAGIGAIRVSMVEVSSSVDEEREFQNMPLNRHVIVVDVVVEVLGEESCLAICDVEPVVPSGPCPPCEGGDVTNSDHSYNATVPSGGTLTLPNVTHTDSDGSPVTLPGMVAFVATPCAPGDDAHVLINQKPVIDLGPGETWDLHVEYPDGTPVGSWNAGAERWEIPECPACDPATAVLKNTDGTILDTEEIPSGGSEDIIAPDATAVLKNSEGTTLDTELIPSGVSENIVVADTTIQRKTESGVDIGVTIALPSGTGPHTVTCPNADVTVNNTSFTDVESGSMVDVVVANTDGTKVGSENAGVWEVPDATAVLKNSAGTTLDTELIPSGVSEDVIAPDATVQLKDSAGTNIGTPVAVPSGVSQNITAPDGTVRTTDGLTTVAAVKSNGTADLPQSVVKYKDAVNADQVTAASNTEYSGGTLRPATQVPRRELTLDGVGTGDYVTLADLIANTVPDVTSPVIDRAITASWAAGDNETIPIILPAEYQGETFAYVSNVGTNGTITVSVDGGSTFAAPPFTVGASGVAFRRTTYSGAGSVLYET